MGGDGDGKAHVENNGKIDAGFDIIGCNLQLSYSWEVITQKRNDKIIWK